MSKQEATGARTTLPLVWRIPPWQASLLILVATGLLALVLYGRFSVGAMLMMGLVAVAALSAAVFALRLLLVADDDGIWVRTALAVQVVEWGEVAAVEAVAVRRTTVTVRINRVDGTYVDVPPSLLLPTVPTRMATVHSIVHGAAMQLSAIAAARRSRPANGRGSS